jgi:hypothetical protein
VQFVTKVVRQNGHADVHIPVWWTPLVVCERSPIFQPVPGRFWVPFDNLVLVSSRPPPKLSKCGRQTVLQILTIRAWESRDGWCQIFDNRLSNLVQAEIWGKNPKVSRAPGVKCQNGTTLNVKFQNRTTSGFHKMVVGTQNIDESDKGVWYWPHRTSKKLLVCVPSNLEIVDRTLVSKFILIKSNYSAKWLWCSCLLSFPLTVPLPNN